MITIESTKTSTILAVEAAEKTTRSILTTLKNTEHKVFHVDSLETAINEFGNRSIDVLILNKNDIGQKEMEQLNIFRRKNPNIEFLLITEMNNNLVDFSSNDVEVLTSDFNQTLFINSLNRALTNRAMKRELTDLRGHVAMSYGYDNIVGISEPIKNLKETLTKISPTDINMLLLGPKGSGKKHTAHTIHYHSKRRRERMVTLDCSFLPLNMIESELFGSAILSSITENPRISNLPINNNTQSLLEKANGGTLFINDIDLMPINAQNLLIKFLQTFEIHDSTAGQTRKADIRLITATSKNLEEMVSNNEFQKDLYHLINVFPIKHPSLNERLEDIELLVEYFLRRFAFNSGGSVLQLNHAALDKIRSYSWPGNIQELENTLLRATAFCKKNMIDAEDIRFVGAIDSVAQKELDEAQVNRKTGLLADNQKVLIKDALESNNWNFTQTAQELGIGRTTLWRKVKKFQLKRGAEEVK